MLWRALLAAWTVLASGCSESISFPAIPPADGQPALGERIGIAGPLAWGNDPARAQTISRLQSLHIRRLRTDFWWHRLETTPGQFDFTELDPAIADAVAGGIGLLPILDYGNRLYPSAAGPNDDPTFFPPSDPSHYGDYVAAVVAHYGDRVTEWEIWNEENIGYRFWKPNPDASAYAGYVRVAIGRGRGACPSCTFVLGGVSMPQPIPKVDLFPAGPAYLAELPPDILTLTDAVAFHPYQYPKDAPEVETAPFPSRQQGSLATQTRAIAALAKRPLWITEEGWPTNSEIPVTDDEIQLAFGIPPNLIEFGRQLLGPDDFAKVLETLRGVSEADQARYLVRAVLIATSLGVPRIFLYTLDDTVDATHKNQEAAFGLYRADGTEKPAAGVLRTLLDRYGSYSFAADVGAAMGLSNPDRALAFRDGNHVAVALWRWQGERSLEIADLPTAVTVVDGSGHTIAQGAAGASVKIALSSEVVWLEATR